MPALPSVTKHHPTAAKENMLLIKDLLAQTLEKTLLNFLHKEFTCIGKEHATRLVAELGKGFDQTTNPRDVSETQATRVQQLLSYARFADPSGDCLSPAGEYNLRLGIMKELAPDWIASYVGGALACGGHPLIVEACVSLGGKDVKAGHNVFRFANRIPLLFEAGADVVTRVAKTKVKWGAYKDLVREINDMLVTLPLVQELRVQGRRARVHGGAQVARRIGDEPCLDGPGARFQPLLHVGNEGPCRGCTGLPGPRGPASACTLIARRHSACASGDSRRKRAMAARCGSLSLV